MNRRPIPWLPPTLCELGVLFLLSGISVFGLHGCGQESGRRVLVLGWGGATWRILDPLLETGQLPNLAALIARGQAGELESIRPPASAAAWTSLSTGKHPGETGVSDWFATRAEDSQLVLNDADAIKAPFIWDHLTGTGLRSFVFGAPLASPARKIDGTLIAGSPVRSEETWTYPASIAGDLRAAGILSDPSGIVTPHAFSIASFHEQLAKKRDFLLKRLPHEDWDLGWIVFEELDELHRLCWPGEHEPELIEAYVALDSLLGELLEIAGPETDVFVVSEHGTRLYDEAYGLHATMLHEGFSAISGPIQPFEPPANASRFEIQNAEHNHRLAVCYYQLTRATASTCAGNIGSVRLGLQGMEAWATIPFENYDQILVDLEERFQREHSPYTLEPVLNNTQRVEELYPGQHSTRNPDLIIEFEPQFMLTNDLVLSTFRKLDPMVAAPELAGIFIAAGPNYPHQAERTNQSILDITPQVLRLLGQDQ